MTTSTDSKLSPAFTWLFAFLSVFLAFGAAFLLRGAGSKVASGVYFGLLVVGGFLSTYLTRAKTSTAVVSFLVAAGGAAAAYYLVIAKLFSVAADAASSTGASNAAEAHAAMNSAGSLIGGFIAVVVFFGTFVPGTIGANVGASIRGKSGTQAATSFAKSLA